LDDNTTNLVDRGKTAKDNDMIQSTFKGEEVTKLEAV
jgi:hypothetical protein